MAQGWPWEARGFSRGSSHEVDYGTDSIPVSDALARTRRDLDQNRQEGERAAAERAKRAAGIDRLSAAIQRFGP